MSIEMEESYEDLDMQRIGNLLSFASRGDRVGLNQMLREGISPNVQDYDKRTALHLAASEGHAPIVELLVHYKANVNLQDRWHRTPLTDARLYAHRDICRILEVNGGIEINDQPIWTLRHEQDSKEVDIDISELTLQQSCILEQGVFGESEIVKWRGTWVVKTVIKRQVYHHHPEKRSVLDRVLPSYIELRTEQSDEGSIDAYRILSAKENTLLRELRHPNILQFLGSIVHGEDMILITEYLPKGNLHDILSTKDRLDLSTTLRFALDIARGMNYLHEHKPFPIVHNHLDPRNLLQGEGGHLKIGDYWVQMFYEQENSQRKDCLGVNKSSPRRDTKKDIQSFGFILYLMVEGRQLMRTNFDFENAKAVDFEPKFHVSKCSPIIKQLVEKCTSKDPSARPSFTAVIQMLEEIFPSPGKAACPVC